MSFAQCKFSEAFVLSRLRDHDPDRCRHEHPAGVSYSDNAALTAPATLGTSSGCSRRMAPRGPTRIAKSTVCLSEEPPIEVLNAWSVTSENPVGVGEREGSWRGRIHRRRRR